MYGPERAVHAVSPNTKPDAYSRTHLLTFPTHMQLTHLGPYVIDKPLGKGGMGSVFAATDPETGQRVAIKALTPHLASAEGFRERFDAEIESLKTLRHEGIVRLYGYGEQDGVLFYSMELVDGDQPRGRTEGRLDGSTGAK